MLFGRTRRRVPKMIDLDEQMRLGEVQRAGLIRIRDARGAAVPVAAAPRERLWAAVPTGPAVGEAVPDFRLPDQQGVVRTRQSLLGPKGALLVFYRSADW